ncbi:CDP-2,3-bis-(O-geranylgeranyl)-sn-glycerol synthase [Candidatus Thorarchaeota archaeon]|nr:MAG: CDP-2,3-bis-(O-geranylgeranyl)-sn-glycerol synthase [Candidatus Thorarchaeota archaeon]
MYEEIALLEIAIWFALPAWIANSTPVIFGGGMPIDRGTLFRDGHRLLGDGKTIRGFVVGVLLGTLTGFIQSSIAPLIFPVLTEYVVVTAEMESLLFIGPITGFLLSLGALMGDLIGSFVKRRIDVKSGNPAPVLDQIGFIIMSLIFASPIIQPAAIYVIILVGVTLGVHWFSNAISFLLGLKDNPW